jgi:diguanylate cyclase (GGDEF)-like protein
MVRASLMPAHKDKFRVLFMADDQSLTSISEKALQDTGVKTHIISEGRLLLSEIEHFVPHLLVIDLVAGYCNGLDLLRIVRLDVRYKSLPIVVVTAAGNDALVEQAYLYGADDFIARPINMKIFQLKILNFIQKRHIFKIACDSDQLTGVYNRRSFLDRAKEAIARSCLHQQQSVFMIMDLDHLKMVNDQYGHDVGDKILSYFGGLLLSFFADRGIVGRWGGDEFVVFIDHMDIFQVQNIIKDLSKQWKEMDLKQRLIYNKLSFSCGISCMEDGQTLEELFKEADKCLYYAKRTGRDRICHTAMLGDLSEYDEGKAFAMRKLELV